MEEVKRIFKLELVSDTKSQRKFLRKENGLLMTYEEVRELVGELRKTFDRLESEHEIDIYNLIAELHQGADPGYVYILQAEKMGAYKIGKTKYLDDRVKQIGLVVPCEIDLFHSMPTDNATKAERLLHKRYAGKRLKGEWFALTEEDLEEIKMTYPFMLDTENECEDGKGG